MSIKEIISTKNLLFILALVVPGISGADTRHGASANIYTDRELAVSLSKPDDKPSFTFVIFGDRTKGSRKELAYLRKAVAEVNIIRPDFVITVGDLVNGSRQPEEWVTQAVEYKKIMNKLQVPWFPAAGNHDIYKGNAKQAGKDYISLFENTFGPIWYAFEHKNSWFIILFTDEGNLQTGIKTWTKASSQRMSQKQTRWLSETLNRAVTADHVFLFQHHPRWEGDIGRNHYGNDWQNTHAILRKAGNVSAVFAGHLHRMVFGGTKDGIEYHTLAVTGGTLNKDDPAQGFLQHYDLVTVRGGQFHVATIPIGNVMDKKNLAPVTPKPAKATGKNSKKKRKVLLSKKFAVNSEAKRLLTYTLTMPISPKSMRNISLGIYNAFDDTGDGGMEYQVFDLSGNIYAKGFVNSKDWDWITLNVPSRVEIKLELLDLDTMFSGKKPGNYGKIKVLLND